MPSATPCYSSRCYRNAKQVRGDVLVQILEPALLGTVIPWTTVSQHHNTRRNPPRVLRAPRVASAARLKSAKNLYLRSAFADEIEHPQFSFTYLGKVTDSLKSRREDRLPLLCGTKTASESSKCSDLAKALGK